MTNTKTSVILAEHKGDKMAEGIYRLTDVVFCFGNLKGPRFQCGYLKNDEVFDYLTKLENFVPPLNRCMQYYCHFNLLLNPRKIRGTMNPQRTLHIINKNPLYMKCQCGATRPTSLDYDALYPCAQQCFTNIETGKCVDPFVVENIGRVFFAKKYEK